MLSLGSNLGDRAKALNDAFRYLTESGALVDARLSTFYETEPVGYADQPMFLNAAAGGWTETPLLSLIDFLKSVEYYMGRKKRGRWREREIDLDLLFYGDSTYESDAVTAPHPRMHRRRFVLEPAAEIFPDAPHPILKKTVAELLAECSDEGKTSQIKDSIYNEEALV